MLGSIFAAITVAAMLNTGENQTIGAETQNEITRTEVIKKEKVLNDNELGLMGSSNYESLGEFHSINLNLNVNVVVVAGNETDVIFDGDTEIASLVDITVEGKALKINAKEGGEAEFLSKMQDEKFTIIVTMKEVKGIVINGSGNIQCHDAVKTNKVAIEINGSGKVHTKLIDVSVPAETPSSVTTASTEL
ncbi:MAG: hypothetical protein GQ574_26925 [Crocinitomix sp.]|nr:hypothetical protein [Crocinitomix sp.]